MIVSVVVALARHRRRGVLLPEETVPPRMRMADRFLGVHRVLETQMHYVDEIYDAAIVQPVQHRVRRRLVEGRRRRRD